MGNSSERLLGDLILTETFSDGRKGVTVTHPESRHATIQKPDPTRRRKPTGWLYPTPYSFSKEVVTRTYGHNKWKVNGFNQFEDYYGPDPSNGASSQLPYHNENVQPYVDRAVTKALLKLKDERINLATNLWEVQQTADLVGTVASRIGKAYTAFTRRDPAGVLRQLSGVDIFRKSQVGWVRNLRKGRNVRVFHERGSSITSSKIPQRWLEYQYAVNPLLMDVHAAVNRIKNAHEVSGWVQTVKGTSGKTDKFVQDFNLGSDWPARNTGKTRLGVFVRLDYIPTNDLLSHASSLGLTNPLEVLWEELPYSFVVDWILPVGDWLSTFDATLGWQFLSGSYSVLWDSSGTFQGLPKSGVSQASNTCQCHWWKKNLTRSVYSSSPLPHLPRLKNPLSLTHMANGLSLLAEAFGRKR